MDYKLMRVSISINDYYKGELNGFGLYMKSETILNNGSSIFKIFSSQITGNELRLHSSNQPINAVRKITTIRS
jgi:hypothetical protein